MSVYQWKEKEWTCDGCGAKHRQPDRASYPPTGWITFDDMSIQRDDGVTHKPGTHFCSSNCVIKAIGECVYKEEVE